MAIEELVKKLPPDLQTEVEDFIQFLLKKKALSKSTTSTKLKLDWAGGLKEFRDQFTALELQRKTLEWRGD